ncbi:hypothetical protein [Aeoliella mucimassa]|uniref:Uncharacterized protein n=1 Tax=Aeoliella mucimassa TaxID=2527972 RepID=A0A518ART7_9BACT|nr:hypothetical protein [Aeoliella mucimassa]QDU57426.1 hypothetical protein Pan181_36420 [Aeoliella mucimassa]
MSDFDQGLGTDNPFASPLSDLAPPLPQDPHLADAERIRQEHISHEASIKSMGFLFILGGGLGVIYTAFMMFGLVVMFAMGPDQNVPGSVLLVIPLLILFLGGLSGFQLWTGLGLRKLNPKVQLPATVLAAFGLPALPIGTLISIYFLWLLQSQKGKYIFSPEYQEIVRLTPHIKYRTSIIVWIFVGLLVIVLAMGVLAAVIIPIVEG